MIIFALLQLRIGRIREVKYPVQGHTAGQWKALPVLDWISRFRIIYANTVSQLEKARFHLGVQELPLPQYVHPGSGPMRDQALCGQVC